MVEFLEVGKITGTHGLKGALRVIPLTDDPARFKFLDYAYVERNGVFEKHIVEETRFSKKHVLVKLKDVNNASAAEEYKDKYLLIDRNNAVRLPEDSFFICDIIGCSVYNDQGVSLGQVSEVLRTGSNDVYVVKNSDKSEILIPALKSVVKDVSVAEKKITVILPEGLTENEI
jgi:16S rRNA processing protein RimM